MSASPSDVTAFGEAGVPTPGLEGGVGIPRVTLTERCEVWSYWQVGRVFKIDSPPLLRLRCRALA